MFDFFQIISAKITTFITVVMITITSILLGGTTNTNKPVDTSTATPSATVSDSASPSPSITKKVQTTTPTMATKTQAKIVNNQFEVSVKNIEYKDQRLPSDIKCTSEEVEAYKKDKDTVAFRNYPADKSCDFDKNRRLSEESSEQGGSGIFVKADLTIKNISILPFATGYSMQNCKVVKNSSKTNFTVGSSSKFQKGLLPGESIQLKINARFNGEDYDSSGNKILPSSDLKVTTCTFTLQTQDNSSIELKVVTF